MAKKQTEEVTELEIVDGMEAETENDAAEFPQEEEVAGRIRTIEERAREIRTGKRVVELPDGSVAVVRLPTNKEDDDANIHQSAAIFRLRKQGCPLLAEMVRDLAEFLGKEDVERIMRDGTLDWLAKADALTNLLGDSPIAGLINRTAEVLATTQRWRYLLARCVLTEGGKNWWDATPYGSYESHPSDDVYGCLTDAFFGFIRDASSSFLLEVSRNGLRSSPSAGDSGAPAKAEAA